MHFSLIRETLSFNLMYVAACYLVGTGMCHNMVGLLQHYKCLLMKPFHDYIIEAKEIYKIRMEVSVANLKRVSIFSAFFFYERLKFHAQLS